MVKVCIYTGGTDNHLILVDLRPLSLDGARVESVLDAAHVTLNKNSVPGSNFSFLPLDFRLGLTDKVEDHHF